MGDSQKEVPRGQVWFVLLPGDRVFCPFGGEGIVVMSGLDDGGKQCYVNTKNGAMWFREDQLTKMKG